MFNQQLLLKAYRLMLTAKAMASVYEKNRQVCKYVHSTSRGHEAIQIAMGLQLRPFDYVSPYYRDDSMLLALGYSPYELMLQLLAKKEDPFSGGRSYYCHPNNRKADKPLIPHQSSATGMQVIPATGMAQGIQYLEKIGRPPQLEEKPVVVCSLGDGSVTEGEVSEAFQFAALHRLPVLYLVQDNGWGISVTAEEARSVNAYEYAGGFSGMKRMEVDGSDFEASFAMTGSALQWIRERRGPVLLHAGVPLLGHHTSGVRKEWYRSEEDMAKHTARDPIPKLRQRLLETGTLAEDLEAMEVETGRYVDAEFMTARYAEDPDPSMIQEHIFAPTPVKEEKGERCPRNGNGRVMMVDAALHAIEEILREFPEAVFFGQDVGRRLGGVFREAATLAEKFGDHRVFNTAIQEAYIIGSTTGLSAVGVKPIVEVQFGDYIYPGFNQLASEIAKSCYLSCGKFPVQAVIRVPVGAYGGGGPYHSACIESTLLAVKGIKVAYPSNAADMKGLMKAAFLDPNPVVLLEHKGLYWSKVPGTQEAQTPEPAADYLLPLGIGKIVLEAAEEQVRSGSSLCVVTYGMGVYWAKAAANRFPGRIAIIDLRTLCPLDEELVYHSVKKHGRCLVLTEEQLDHSFAQALAGRISAECFRWLDTPVQACGAINLPAVPLNMRLEEEMLPGVDKLAGILEKMLAD